MWFRARREWEQERARRLQEGEAAMPLLNALVEAHQSDDHARLRELLSELTRITPGDRVVRHIAAITYDHIGDETEAMRQLAIAVALDPAGTTHKKLAAILYRDGDPCAAEAVLAAGWQRHVAYFGKWERGKRREEARARYFAIPGRTDAPVE